MKLLGVSKEEFNEASVFIWELSEEPIRKQRHLAEVELICDKRSPNKAMEVLGLSEA